MVSPLDVREGILDGSVMPYKVMLSMYYNETGRIGDQRYVYTPDGEKGAYSEG